MRKLLRHRALYFTLIHCCSACRQAEGPDASPCGELAVGPSGGGHSSRPPPVRDSASLCPYFLGKGVAFSLHPSLFPKSAFPLLPFSCQASVEVQSLDRYGRRNQRVGEPVPGNGLLRARKRLKTCRRRRKTEARGCFCYAAEQKKRKKRL